MKISHKYYRLNRKFHYSLPLIFQDIMDPWKLGPLKPKTVNNIQKIKTEDSFTKDKRVEDMFNIFQQMLIEQLNCLFIY